MVYLIGNDDIYWSKGVWTSKECNTGVYDKHFISQFSYTPCIKSYIILPWNWNNVVLHFKRVW